MKHLPVCVLIFAHYFVAASSALAGPVALHVAAAGVARRNAPVIAELKVPAQVSEEDAKAYAAGGFVLQPGDVTLEAEVVKIDGKIAAVRLFWIEPEIAADQKKVYAIQRDKRAFLVAPPEFSFKDGDDHRDLLFGKLPVWRHYSTKYDAKDHANTFKYFHHVNTFDGQGFITQATGGKQFPHHRGLYMGFMKTQADGKSYDTWHGKDGVAVRHKQFNDDRQLVGQVVARSSSTGEWCTGQGKAMVIETRDLLTWNGGAGERILDFDITLTSAGGDVKLDGDAQHAGFQFRAAGEVGASKAKYVYPAAAKNKGNDVWENCPWVAGKFAIGGKPYVVAHLDTPGNPDESKTVYSTRDYGRFGPFAAHVLMEGKPLHFRYRIVILDGATHGDTSVEYFDNLHAGFAKPVQVTLGPG